MGSSLLKEINTVVMSLCTAMLHLPLLLLPQASCTFLNGVTLSIPVTTVAFNCQSVTPLIYILLFFNFLFPTVSFCPFLNHLCGISGDVVH